MNPLPWSKLPRWISREGVLRQLSRSTPAVLIVLLSHADEHGSVCISQVDAAQESGLSEATAKRAFRELELTGIIEILAPRSGRRPATIRVNMDARGVTGDRSTVTGQGRPVTHDPATTADGSPLTGHGCAVSVDRSSVTPQERVDRSWVTPKRTHIGTRVRRQEEKRERETLTLSHLKTDSWHPTARLIVHCPNETQEFYARFITAYEHEIKLWGQQAVAIFLVKFPKAEKLLWTVPDLIELGKCVSNLSTLTLNQVCMVIDELVEKPGDRKTAIPQLPETKESLAKREKRNERREDELTMFINSDAFVRGQNEAVRLEILSRDQSGRDDLIRAVFEHIQSRRSEVVWQLWNRRCYQSTKNPTDALEFNPLGFTNTAYWFRHMAVESGAVTLDTNHPQNQPQEKSA